jgi:hypothetical protein
VAYNIVGPALTQALRVLRYPKHNPDGTLWATDKEDPETVATTCPEEHAATVITSEEKRRLREDSEMLDALENIYSLTCVAAPYPWHISLIWPYNIQAERPDLKNKCPYSGGIWPLPTSGVPNLAVHQHILGEALLTRRD